MSRSGYPSPRDFDLLRAEVLALRTEVDRLRARVSELEQAGFDLVEHSDSLEVPPLRVPSSSTSASGSGVVARPSAPTPAGRPSREEICRGIGLFLRRALEGRQRGASGRDLLDLASRLWLVVRDYSGRVYEPPLVFTRFSDCKGQVKRGQDAGDSVFVGLPSRGDIRIVLEAGSFQLPPDL